MHKRERYILVIQKHDDPSIKNLMNYKYIDCQALMNFFLRWLYAYRVNATAELCE